MTVPSSSATGVARCPPPPTDFMASIYSDLVDKLFIYTSNVWSQRAFSDCNQDLFLVIKKEDHSIIPELIQSEIKRRVSFLCDEPLFASIINSQHCEKDHFCV